MHQYYTGAALRAWLVYGGGGDGGGGGGGGRGGGLLPRSMEEARAAGLVKIRSTSTRRTLQSAQSLVLGLYPLEGASASAASEPFDVEIRDRMRESMFPNPGMACGRHEELMQSLDGDDRVTAAEAAAWGRGGLAALRKEVHARNVAARRKLREQAAAGTGDTSSIASSSSRGEATVASVSESPAVKTRAAFASTSTSGAAAATAGAVPEHLQRDPRPPSVTSVWEPLQARANHGLSLPDGVDASDLAVVRRAAEVGGLLHTSRNSVDPCLERRP